MIFFFRDFLSGWVYVIYVLICVFLQFSLFGIVADRKRKVIEEGLQAKRKRDIESGELEAKAALADKQILDVYDENEKQNNQDNPENQENKDKVENDSVEQTEQEEAPQVLIIGDDEDNKEDNK